LYKHGTKIAMFSENMKWPHVLNSQELFFTSHL